MKSLQAAHHFANKTVQAKLAKCYSYVLVEICALAAQVHRAGGKVLLFHVKSHKGFTTWRPVRKSY